MTRTDRFARLAQADRALLRPERLPAAVVPMKAVLTDERFSDGAWIFERKLDGIRCLARCQSGRATLASRNGLSLDTRFPELVEALARAGDGASVLDGEVVAFEGRQTSFARLQQRGGSGVAVFLYLFDVLHLDGQDTTRLPLRARKALLREALRFGGPLRLSAYRRREGERLFADACARGWEGLIAKRLESPYTHGRSRDWLKFKCSAGQELVVGGYTAPRGTRTALGALLLGYHEDGRLRYAGKVGSGFTQAVLEELAGRLRPLRQAASPFADKVREPAVTWVAPELVAEVAFTEWTRDGRLRHPRFLGLREDKPARSVVRE